MKTNEPEIRAWINAGITLRENPKATVVCPNCNKGHLKVTDVPVEGTDKVDRYMICDNCGSYNVITFSEKSLD